MGRGWNWRQRFWSCLHKAGSCEKTATALISRNCWSRNVQSSRKEKKVSERRIIGVRSPGWKEANGLVLGRKWWPNCVPWGEKIASRAIWSWNGKIITAALGSSHTEAWSGLVGDGRPPFQPLSSHWDPETQSGAGGGKVAPFYCHIFKAKASHAEYLRH